MHGSRANAIRVTARVRSDCFNNPAILGQEFTGERDTKMVAHISTLEDS